ncbi:hypothetical protein [Brevundimonas sp.]|uniref:hypothetical protein n=1 Tax=Brevundimonas sp. TaxID=1871086 RepID=UPI00286A25E2|nr:hypothetical protein [Brevundimonas sp.]
MAKLPQSIDMQGPNGATASGRAVDFSSIGGALESAGAQVARWDESRRVADDAVAGREIETVQQDYALAAGLRAEEYDGRDPGYAARELAAFDAHYAPVLARTDVPDGVRDSLTRQTRELRARVGQQAIAVETTTRGRRASADRDAADQAGALQALMRFQDDFDGRSDARRQAWDGASPGFAAGTMEDFTAAQEAALADLPPNVADRLKPMLLSRQVTLQAQAMAAEDEGREAGTMATISQGLQGLVNRAARDPSLMARFDEEIAPILAAAPAALRDRLEKETRERAQVGAIEARIQAGDYDAVEAEAERGAYDWMDPGTVARTREAVKSARANGVIEDAQAAADLEAQVAADLRGVLAGGQPDAALVQRARLIGGDALAVKVETDQKAALEVRPLMARVRTMTADQLSSELERLQASATDAVGARALELAGAMIEADRGLRSDPAAWAATPTGPGDRVAEGVRDRWRGFTAEPTAETAQAYARATWIAQREGGVPLSQRRILDSGTAEAWVGSLDAEGEAGDGLAALAARAALFGREFQPQVLRELTLAGLKPADLGALTHYAGSPRRMALYVQSRALTGDDRADKDTRDQVDAALTTALAPYMRAIGSQRGGPATIEAARVLAYGMAARGESVRDAVRTATAPMTDAYEFEDDWALPAASGHEVGRVRAGARNLVSGLIRQDGSGLFAPASTRMTPDQSRRVYADMVRERATWRNLADDSGLELVMTDAQGRPVRVRDAAGQDVVRTWAQLTSER